MLALAVESYLSVRRAAGFLLHDAGLDLKNFATYSDLQGQHHVRSTTAIEWARQASSRQQRARRLAHVARLARYLRAEDERHEIPPAVFGSESRARPTPYILSDEQIHQLVALAAQAGYRTLRRQTYSTLFALLSCTGLRVSEAIRLRYADITPDGLLIRATKFNKSRLVPLHETARAGTGALLGTATPLCTGRRSRLRVAATQATAHRRRRIGIPHRGAGDEPALRARATPTHTPFAEARFRGPSAQELPGRS
jgi:integrase/recombinase XerD